MRRYLSLLGQYFIQYAKVRLAHRGDFLLSIITMTGATFFGIAVVYLMFARTPRIAGWSFDEILFLYGFSVLPMSIFNTLSINLYYFSENYIVQGKFDRVLLRPLDSLFQILFEQFRLEALGDGILGIFVIVTASARMGLPLGPLEWLWIGFAAICGSVIYIAVFTMLTCVSFWMDDRVGVIPPVYNMLAFGRYPMDIYGGGIRFVMTWLVPFGFATFYPAALLLKGGSYAMFAWLLPLIAAIFMTLAVLLWRRGTRHYSSTGS
jgi:ABC-2 type transport system permease protein